MVSLLSSVSSLAAFAVAYTPPQKGFAEKVKELVYGDGFGVDLAQTQTNQLATGSPAPVMITSPAGDRLLSTGLNLANPVNYSTGSIVLDSYNVNKLSSANFAKTSYEDVSLFKGKFLDRFL